LVFHSDFPKKEEVDRYWNLTVGFSKDLNLISLWTVSSSFWILDRTWILVVFLDTGFLYQSTSDTKLMAQDSLYNCSFTLF
jgi:hypothetical protein